MRRAGVTGMVNVVPTDDPEDPQNVWNAWQAVSLRYLIFFAQWSDFRKGVQLLIITLAAIVPDFDSGIGPHLLSSVSSLLMHS